MKTVKYLNYYHRRTCSNAMPDNYFSIDIFTYFADFTANHRGRSFLWGYFD